MLTDDEIREIFDSICDSERAGTLGNDFARAIERAALAKAWELEPVGFIKHDLTPFLYYKDSLRLKPDDHLYVHPLPAQAIPEGCREVVEAVAHIGIDFGYGAFELSQEHIDKARALLSATPKP